MSKQRIRDVFKESLDNVRSGKQPNVSQAMRNHGYSESSSRALKVTQTRTWAELKKKYLNDEIALKTFNDLASAENQDKDNRLKASIEIMKLNNRYPDKKIKLGLSDERDSVFE